MAVVAEQQGGIARLCACGSQVVADAVAHALEISGETGVVEVIAAAFIQRLRGLLRDEPLDAVELAQRRGKAGMLGRAVVGAGVAGQAQAEHQNEDQSGGLMSAR